MADPIDVFISYKREERGLAERVMAALQKAGYVAVADLNISKSDDFAQSIDRMIRAARLTLVLWSRASAGSEWVQREAQLVLALQREGKPNQYLGVMVEPLGAALRVDFHGLQMVDVSSNGLDLDGVDTVVAEVRTVLGRPHSANWAVAETRSAAAMDELRLFQLVRGMDTASGYEHFLSVYPVGKFAQDARTDLARARAWYMHPFRRGSIGHTVAFTGVLAAIGFGLWGAAQRDSGSGVSASVHQRVVEDRDAAQAAKAAAKAESARLAGQVGDLTRERAALLARLAEAERSAAAEAEAAKIATALAESREQENARARELLAAMEKAAKQAATTSDCTLDGQPGFHIMGKCYALLR